MDRADLLRGFKDGSPLVPGIVPFGLVAGIASVEAGLHLGEAVAMSVVVFAGAAQLAALDLLGQDAPLVIVVLTAGIINLRMVMYSASIAPYFRTLSGAWKAFLAYLLTDQAYALSIVAYRADRTVNRAAYYLGVALVIWISWQVATVAGFILGTGVPDAWGLEFVVPLVFLALLGPAVQDWPSLVAAVVGGGVAVLGAGLPFNLALVVGGLAGIVGGVTAEWRKEGARGD